MRLCGLGRFGKFNIGSTGKEAHRIDEIDVIELANIRDDIAAFAAAEAMPGLRHGINFAGRRFFLMERTAAPEVLAALAHNRAFSEKLHQIVGLAYFTYVLIGENGAHPPFFRPA